MRVRMRERGEVLGDLCFKLKQQSRELVARVGEHVARIGVDDRGAEKLHHVQRGLGERDRVLIARIAVVIGIEITDITPNACTIERATLQELRVIARYGMFTHFAKRRLQHPEQDCNVSYAARDRPSRVLLVADWNNSVL